MPHEHEPLIDRGWRRMTPQQEEWVRQAAPFEDAWRRLRAVERPFWDRVAYCPHGPDCEECCWPYTIPEARKRYDLHLATHPDPGSVQYNRMSIARACVTYSRVPAPRIIGNTRRRCDICSMGNCANPHHVAYRSA